MLPVSAACVVATAVRETLGALFGEAVVLKLYEPAIPAPAAWDAIVRDATIYRVRGARADAAVIVRAADARVLAAAAFGEREPGAAALSPLERSVLERTIRAIAAHFAPICGTGAGEPVVSEQSGAHGFTTFFELQLERPVRARIGIALSRDPQPEPRPGIELDDLLDLSVELAVQLDAGTHTAAAIAALEPGAVMALPPGGLRGSLALAGRKLAVGECGVNGRHYALAIDHAGRDEPES